MGWVDDYKDEGPWDFVEQPNKLGYLNNPRWSSRADAQAFCEAVGLSLNTKDHEPCGHWHKQSIPLPVIELGKFYCSYPSTGPVYYPENYSICKIDVDSMSIEDTVELPTLISGYGLCPRMMAISSTHIYVLCSDGVHGANPPPYLAIIKIRNMSLIGYVQLPDTSDSGSPVILDIAGFDLGITKIDRDLVIYCHAGGGPLGNDYAVYRKYSIGSGGIPIQSDEVIFEDLEYRESGTVGSALVTGELYIPVGMNTDAGRLVKLVENPFNRDSFFDNSINIMNEQSLCYGICYDVSNDIVYMIINYSDVSGYQQKIVKIDILTMSLVDTLILSSEAYLTLSAVCDHPDNGFFYVSSYDVHVSPKVSIMYEIRISDFTVTRSTNYRGCTAQSNNLYPDSEKGYIYYCGHRIPGEEYNNFYRFDLISFTDDLAYIPVSDPLLHWGIISAQSYQGPSSPGDEVSEDYIDFSNEPLVWPMPE